MVSDLQLMKDITPLFEKKLVIWGMGQRGHAVLEEIISMGAGEKGIFLCDSDQGLQGRGTKEGQYKIMSPNELQYMIKDICLKDIAILVTVRSPKVQDEILLNVQKLFGDNVIVYTDYAIELGIYLNVNNLRINKTFRVRELAERNKKAVINQYIKIEERIFRYFAFLPLHHDEIILVYQCGKVGSKSVFKSIVAYGRNVLHCHTLRDVGNNDEDLYRLLNLKSGKIICLVRDPVAKAVAAMWQSMNEMERYSIAVDFAEIEKYFLSDNLADQEFGWFDNEMKRIFQIDVFEYPFDREQGWTIIKKGNIELLLLKLEKLNDLEHIIGNFLDIYQFHLIRENVGEEKAYRFAYREYKENLHIAQEQLEEIYNKNERMKHFYTEQERQNLYEKWCKCVSGKK